MARGWRRLRRRVLELDGWRCRSCGKAGRLEVDHIIPVFQRPDLELSLDNLQCLCGACHKAKSRRERETPVSPARRAWRDLAAESLSHDRLSPVSS